ncbi:MAG: hypothetical protein EBS36_00110 [Actinobacteria bacterium]|nr:hypothetical protein [Actinomycetota bacterium]NBY16076.1 hypothetical protein [Actinomycetota bacterium]
MSATDLDGSAEYMQFRIIDPCGRVIAQRRCPHFSAAIEWLQTVQKIRHDPFLEVQRQVADTWISRSNRKFHQ